MSVNATKLGVKSDLIYGMYDRITAYMQMTLIQSDPSSSEFDLNV